MLLLLIGALLGVPAGLAIDALSAHLAREWYGNADEGADDEAGGASPPPRTHDLASGRLPFVLDDGAVWRTAAMVIVTAVIFALVWRLYGDHVWEAAVASAYASVLITCTATDLMAGRIANVVTYPAIAGVFVIGMIAPGADRLDVLYGGLVAGGVLFAFALLPGNGIGDAKLGLFLGLALGLHFAFPALVIMALAGGVVAFAILIGSRLRARRAAIPYGPYISLGMLVVMLLGGTAFRSL